ncbi:ABC transporter permease [Shewanella sp. Choline-02u-19]|jgi:putative ABC transport system permease protein|uniref:ABC transporter permease n=1 Tax=unclassified Shewanella TaxID=196818 RepID=UPI000C32E06E|nr:MULTISPECIES: FtsX-like permease family protein [unclassified Shewanella]PKG56423.1 ABC transporter permease [Shewanella sp. GutDb-MelDb]PKG74173.1 ABC transporter permease [Shewanella sp. GutCb]PKH55833.1 ABC transporter permease [Shewanella sp. Bg11-22]PKI27196.1 ABC transporter permease [Shewanella sp. Choline-02u-19]
MELKLAWRLFKRELSQGQLLLIILAITLAVLSVTGLASVSERLQLAINGQASKFIAADRIINSPKEIDPAVLAIADKIGLARVTSMQFNSMVYAGDEFQLVTVRAVEQGYPLKGNIELSTGIAQGLPSADDIWFETRLGGLLGYPQQIEIGNANFNLSNEIIRLPDAGFNPFASSPVVLMRIEDVAKTQVIQPGSRVTYLYQFAGDAAKLEAFEVQAKPLLNTSQRWVDVQSGDSPIASAVKRAERFLLLASLLGIALACAAIGIAAQRYCQRHYDVVAMLKTFGASAKQIRILFGTHLLLVTVVGVVLGLIGGVGLDRTITAFLPVEIAAYNPPMSRPLLLGIGTGFISAFMFSAYPLMRLLSIPPLRVLQRQLEGLQLGMWLHLLLSLSAMALLGYLYSQSLPLTLTVVAAVLLLGTLLSVLGFFMIRLGHSVGMKTTNPLQLALAGLRRRARQNAVQLVGFSSALVLLLTIFALRQDLLNEWQKQLPENAPNYFLVNIAPEETATIADFLKPHVKVPPVIYPVIRGRLTAINDELLISSEQKEAGGEGRVGISRELNLTFRDSMPDNNEILSGRFNQDIFDVSVESGVAERLELALGDSLTYTIDNQSLTVKVASIRAVHWETLQPNFFMIFTKEALAPFAYTSMSSFHLEESQRGVILSLIKQFPTVSIIDVGAMVKQLREIIDQVSLSLTLVLVLVLLASALVMIAQTEAGMATRQRELAVLRTFGASGWLLRAATGLEFALLGTIAGVLAVIVAEFTLYLLKTQVFELNVYMHWPWWGIAPLCGGLVVALLGLWSCRQLLNKSCSELLKGH